MDRSERGRRLAAPAFKNQIRRRGPWRPSGTRQFATASETQPNYVSGPHSSVFVGARDGSVELVDLIAVERTLNGDRPAGLTFAEKRAAVLTLLDLGSTAEEAAEMVGVSKRTVERYRAGGMARGRRGTGASWASAGLVLSLLALLPALACMSAGESAPIADQQAMDALAQQRIAAAQQAAAAAAAAQQERERQQGGQS